MLNNNIDTKQYFSSESDKATLISETIPENLTHCLTFYYQMKDNLGLGKLKVIISEDIPMLYYPNWYIVWFREGDQGDKSKENEWLSAQVNIQSHWIHRIKIQAVRGRGFAVSSMNHHCY